MVSWRFWAAQKNGAPKLSLAGWLDGQLSHAMLAPLQRAVKLEARTGDLLSRGGA